MISPLVVVLPIFALVVVVWLARRMGVLGPHVTGERNRFVVVPPCPRCRSTSSPAPTGRRSGSRASSGRPA